MSSTSWIVFLEASMVGASYLKILIALVFLFVKKSEIRTDK